MLISFVALPFTFDQRFTSNITALALHLQKVHQQVLDTAKTDARQAWKDKMTASPYGARSLRHARKAFTPPLTALRRDDGYITTSPDSMDHLLRTKWEQIYLGNSGHHLSTITNYLTKYAKYIFCHSAFDVTELTGDDLFNTIASSGHTSQGMDHWAYVDLSLLPASFHYLAKLLSLIEHGQPWPEQLLFSRAHLLSKNPGDTLNPLEYRFLMIT